MELDDRMLADIGITRDEVMAEVTKTVLEMSPRLALPPGER